MTVYITKADGSKQLFDKEKIVQTCQRMGANREVAIQVAQEVEKNLNPDITTQQILQIIFIMMRKHKPAVKYLFDLKQGISLMESKPEFEVFVRVLLAHSGFQVKPNEILRGLCGVHEVDALVTKDGLTHCGSKTPQ